jgi:uncharacterized membrane protein YbhN (UPF0104 family)
MLSRLRAHWLTTLALIAIVGLVIAVNPRELFTAVDRVRLPALLLMAGVTIASLAARGLAWRSILRRLGVDVPVRQLLRVEFAAQAMVLMPAADLARATLLRRASTSARHKKASEIAATIVLDELCFMITLTLAAVPQAIGRRGPSLLVLAVLGGFAVIVATLVFEPVYLLGLRVVESVKPLGRWDRQLRNLRPAFTGLLDARTLGAVAFFDGCAVAFSVLLLCIALIAVGAHSASPVTAGFALAVANVSSGVSLVPLGLGVFEGTVTVLVIAKRSGAGTSRRRWASLPRLQRHIHGRPRCGDRFGYATASAVQRWCGCTRRSRHRWQRRSADQRSEEIMPSASFGRAEGGVDVAPRWFSFGNRDT